MLLHLNDVAHSGWPQLLSGVYRLHNYVDAVSVNLID